MINKAIVQQIRTISPVWIVPLVALAIAVWLAVQARLEKGAVIQITFTEASDVIAGQTLIKLKDVQVGMVQSVRLSSDLKTVVLKVEIDRSVSEHLSENTRFWVVTPRISATGVSNLGTLISGVYIVMDPGEKGGHTSKFIGLDESPAFVSGQPGTQYVFRAQELGSLDIGSPIYFREIRVGEVTSYQLSPNSDYVDISFFIHAPHDALVRTRSRFWNVSGFGINIGADGIKAKMTSLASLVSGGVAFDNAISHEKSTVADSMHRFYLHPDRESVLEGQFDIEYFYVLKFSSTVRGLTVGAPVEFRGIKIGEVVNIELTSAENIDNTLHVYIAMEPQRLEPGTTPTREEVDKKIDKMIAQGLRAQMKTGSLITGSRYIELAFFEDQASATLIHGENVSEIPTADDSIELITKQLSDVLDNVSKIPFDDIGKDLASSMSSLSVILGTLAEQNTAQKMDGAVENLGKTLASANDALSQVAITMKSIDQAIAPDSEFKYELTEMLKSVGDAAEAMGLLMNELNRHPNALISGAKKDE